MSREVAKMLAPFARRLRLAISRAVVSLVADGGGVQGLQVKLLSDEVRDNVERLQNYGFTGHPHSGAEGVYLSLNGSRDHGVVICVEDRRYRMVGLRGGEVAMYDDLGQSVHLTRDGIVVKGAGRPMLFTDTPKVRFETDVMECTGDIHDRCDSDAGMTMSGMRSIYNSHHHDENDAGGPTDTPNQVM